MVVRVMFLAVIVGGFAAGLVKAESPTTASKPADVAKNKDRSISAIRTDVSAALSSEAKSRRTGDNTLEVLRLVDLYREMATHSQHDTSDALKELGQQVRLRLITIRDRVKHKIAATNNTKKNDKPPRTANLPETRVLAQQLGQPQPNAGAVRQNAAQGLAVTGVQRPTGLPADMGPELVELIEAVISPETWNINGGNGAIVYYAPMHVLVVSAPAEVHAQVGDALGQLNAAQRRQDGAQVAAGVNAVQAGN